MTIAELLRCAAKAATALLVMAAAAQAQGLPPGSPGPQNPACVRLEGQLVALERGAPDPALSDQMRRYEEAANQQQFELDRTVAQSRRMGCEGSGFFLFGLGQPAQCDQLNGQIQRMRANLDRILADLQQIRGGSGQTEGQRRAILAALAQNNCGPQYRAAMPTAPTMPPPPSGFFGSLFGSAPQMPGGDPSAVSPGSGFRTVCVRTCDGYFFPVSQLTTPAKFGDDEQACRRLCPATDVALYTYRVPGEDVSQAVSAAGRPYTELPNAFRYRQEFNPSCSCRRAGESWNDALKNAEDHTVERGDVIVTEEKAKQLSQPPKPDLPPQVKQTNRKGSTRTPGTPHEAAAAPPSPAPAATTAPVAATPSAPPEPTAAPPAETGKRSVRTVGPQFLPAR